MPPVDRRNPIRAKSSESSMSLMEFMREYPDDETCLRHVWRERFAPDGEHAFCERCEAERVFKRYETAQKRPCWFCQTCGHRIHPLKGTILSGRPRRSSFGSTPCTSLRALDAGSRPSSWSASLV